MRAWPALALLVPLVVGWLAFERLQERRGSLRSASSEALDAVRAELAEERAALAQLEREVARQEGELAALRSRLAGGAAPGPADAPAPEPADAAGMPAGGELPRAHPVFDEERLAPAGLSERDASDLRRLFEDTELQRLALRDQATREGWPPDRLASELGALDERLLAVRRDRGEATYDWFLYATGRPNRVVVQGILGRSAAEEAGLRSGDVIYAYGGSRLFEPEELVQSTHEGRLNERIELDVERDGSRLRVTVPRGPLGVKVAGLTMEPEGPVAR